MLPILLAFLAKSRVARIYNLIVNVSVKVTVKI